MNVIYKINEEKLIGVWAPIFIFLTICTNSILSNFGIRYLYLALIIAMYLLLMKNIKSNVGIYFFLLILYLGSIFSLILPHIIFLNEDISVLVSAGLYIIAPIFWVLYFLRFDSIMFFEFINKTIPIVYVVAALGIVQFFYSPGLFGLIEINSKATEWAIKESFLKYSLYFRASSTLGSPQVFGLFIALYIILIDVINKNKPKQTQLGLVFLFFAGLLSGNKSFIVILFIYYLYKCLHLYKKKYFFPYLFSGIAFISIIFYYTSDYVPILERMISLDLAIEQESSDSRMDKYLYIVENANPFYGNGLGSLTNRAAEGIQAAESYIFKIFYECGIIPFTLFLICMLFTIRNAKKVQHNHFQIFMSLIVFSMIIVHAFESPTFFVFWGAICLTFKISYENKIRKII